MIQVYVNGNIFRLWEDATVGRTLDDASGKFSLSTFSVLPKDVNIKAGDFVKILIDGEPKITGFVDEISASGDDSSHTITISGRDNVQDLIDSSVPDSQKNLEGSRTLKQLCESVIKSLGLKIEVVDNSNQKNLFSAEELESAESGTTGIDFLQSFSRKKQVFLIPSGDGKLIIYRPGDDVAPTDLVHDDVNSNVKSWGVRVSFQGRFNKYVCKSQDNVGFSDSASYEDSGTSIVSKATDPEIRVGRRLEFMAEESMSAAQTRKRADEESNIRRARATEYSAVVQGHGFGGHVWDIGQRVNVTDVFADVSGKFIIRSVSYNQSLGGGMTTSITCAPIDAYSVQAEKTAQSSRKSSAADRLKSNKTSGSLR